MTTTILKKKIIKSIDSIEDENFLNALQVIIENRNQKTSFKITERQRKILRGRLASIHNGTAELVSWQSVKNNIKKAKRAINLK
jgi:hypothetical protein